MTYAIGVRAHPTGRVEPVIIGATEEDLAMLDWACGLNPNPYKRKNPVGFLTGAPTSAELVAHRLSEHKQQHPLPSDNAGKGTAVIELPHDALDQGTPVKDAVLVTEDRTRLLHEFSRCAHKITQMGDKDIPTC